MSNLMRVFLMVLVCTFSTCLYAQNEAKIQQAFSESYTHEYNKKYSDAINVLVRLNENDRYEVNLRLGWLYFLNHNYTQSRNHYQKAVNNKRYSLEAKFGLIKALSALESWENVLAQYQEILKIDPQNSTANYWAGVIYYNRKKYEQAARLFEKAVNLYPFDYDATHMLAWTYLNLGRSNDAKVLFNKALMIKPGDESSLAGLNRVR